MTNYIQLFEWNIIKFYELTSLNFGFNIWSFIIIGQDFSHFQNNLINLDLSCMTDLDIIGLLWKTHHLIVELQKSDVNIGDHSKKENFHP